MPSQRRHARITVPGVAPFSLSLHPPGELVSDQLAAHGIWEPYETTLVTGFLKPGMCVVDAGANLGYYTCLAARLVGRAGRVHAFEPDPENHRLLERNTADLGDRVIVHAEALGERAGTARLAGDRSNMGDAHLEPDGSLVVPVARGDDLGLARLDLLKIDTQGAEVQVLAGFRATLGANPAASIIVEAWPWGLARAGSSAAELLAILEALHRPAWLIDHQAHVLRPLTGEGLRTLLLRTLTVADRGFVNLWLGDPPG